MAAVILVIQQPLQQARVLPPLASALRKSSAGSPNLRDREDDMPKGMTGRTARSRLRRIRMPRMRASPQLVPPPSVDHLD